MNLFHTFNMITNFILLQLPDLPDSGNNSGGDTSIDAPIDDYLNIGILVAVVLASVIIYKMRKSYQKA